MTAARGGLEQENAALKAEVARMQSLLTLEPTGEANEVEYRRKADLYTHEELKHAFVAVALHRDLLALGSVMKKAVGLEQRGGP